MPIQGKTHLAARGRFVLAPYKESDKSFCRGQGDALAPGSAGLAEGSFYEVTAMEAIEHFSRTDGRRLVAQAAAMLKPGGVFIATSAFPDTR